MRGSSTVGLTHVIVSVKGIGGERKYEGNFLADTGATDTFVPSVHLHEIGVKPIGTMAYELADGSLQNYQFGLVEISFMEEITAGRVVFAPDNAEPLLG